MREIELGKLLGEKPQTNIVEFIGCVTTQGKKNTVHPTVTTLKRFLEHMHIKSKLIMNFLEEES